MGIVSVNGIRMRAFHGCIAEEGIIGGDFSVDVKVHAPFLQAVENDDIKHAINYVEVTKIVKQEFKIRERLIETVAYRLIKSLQAHFTHATEVEITVTKYRAPIESDVQNVSVYLNTKDMS